MNKQAFKQRMQNLKSYRENNPGKGYWDWKVQAYQNGGDIPLWQQYQYSGPSYQDVLDDLKQNSPSTYNQLQQSMDERMNIMPQYPIPNYKYGEIHIKKKNRGKFNALKKRTGKSTEELTHSKNPLTRKRAIFAQNAKKWNKGKKKK